MPSYTLDEMREQARKAARYFGTGMQGFGKDFIALRHEDVVIVVATGEAGNRLEEFTNDNGVGTATVGVEDLNQTAAPGDPAPAAPAVASGLGPVPEGRSELQANSEEVQNLEVVLVPMYHEPSGEFRNKPGNVHLHVLNDAQVGRRTRLSGECLCSKKHGSKERMPEDGETKMCVECVKVAADNGIAWSLS